MSEIYWVTRLDGIRGLFMALIGLCVAITIIALMSYILGRVERMEVSSKHMAISGIVAIVFGVALVLTPTTKEMMLIYAAGGSIDYIKNNEIAKQLPDKCVQAIDALISEYLTTETNDN